MSPDAPNSVYKMDLERGEVVEEWKVHEDAKVTSDLTEFQIRSNDWGKYVHRTEFNSIFPN